MFELKFRILFLQIFLYRIKHVKIIKLYSLTKNVHFEKVGFHKADFVLEEFSVLNCVCAVISCKVIINMKKKFNIFLN